MDRVAGILKKRTDPLNGGSVASYITVMGYAQGYVAPRESISGLASTGQMHGGN